MPLPSPVLELFEQQHGLLARVQARALLDRNERRSLYRHGDVDHITTRVLRHRACPYGLGTRLCAPVLDALPGACLWERSAALWWGFGRDRSPVVHVARRSRPEPDAIGRLHRISDLDPLDVVLHDGIPTARPERTILSLAATETRKYRPSRLPDRRGGEDVILLTPAIRTIERILDHAWSLGLIDGEFIHDLLERQAVQGRNGIVVLREALRRRPPDYLPPESGAERRFEELLMDLVDQFQRQVEIEDPEGLIGRVDYLARRWPLVVEINGEFGHTSLSDRASDDVRYERLLSAGYSVLVLWQYDVWQRGDQVRRIVGRVLSRPDERPTLHRPTPAPWELLTDRGSFGRVS